MTSGLCGGRELGEYLRLHGGGALVGVWEKR